MASKAEIDTFRESYEKHKKTPEGKAAQKKKAAHHKKMTKPQPMAFTSTGKMVGKHHIKAEKEKVSKNKKAK